MPIWSPEKLKWALKLKIMKGLKPKLLGLDPGDRFVGLALSNEELTGAYAIQGFQYASPGQFH